MSAWTTAPAEPGDMFAALLLVALCTTVEKAGLRAMSAMSCRRRDKGAANADGSRVSQN